MSSSAPALDPATLYRRYAPMVLRRVRCFFGESEAEEVLHEIFMKLLERPASFDGRASVVTWLYRVATNHCIDRLRVQRRRSELLSAHARDCMPQEQAARAEQLAFVRQLFSELDPELARIGVYSLVDGLSHREIARIEDCSARTVGNRLDALRITLQARMR